MFCLLQCVVFQESERSACGVASLDRRVGLAESPEFELGLPMTRDGCLYQAPMAVVRPACMASFYSHVDLELELEITKLMQNLLFQHAAGRTSIRRPGGLELR